MRHVRTVLLLLGAVVLSGSAPRRAVHSETLLHGATGHALGCIPSDAERSYILEVLSQLNDYRLANGLGLLTHDLTMQAAMEGHCHHMPQHGFFAHVHSYSNEPESQTPSRRAQANGAGTAGYGENIAFGYATPTAVMNAWKASPGHNANMLTASYTRVGIGYYSGGAYWGQLFGFGAAVSPDTSAPSVVTPAGASPPTVTGATSALSVLGTDDGGELNLTYTWSATAGPAPVGFSPNGTNAAKNSTATFSMAGSYTLRVSMRDSTGLTTLSTVGVTVDPTATSAAVTPAAVSVQTAGTQPFAAQALDQFGDPMAASFSWSVGGGGSIDSFGTFTAGGAPGGPFTVTATSGSAVGTADVTVTTTAPTLTTILVSPGAAVAGYGGTAPFSAIGYDQVGNPLFAQPAFLWSVDGGGAIDAAGLFTAGATPGSWTVTAASGSVSGIAGITVVAPEDKKKKCGASGWEPLLLLLIARTLRRRRRPHAPPL